MSSMFKKKGGPAFKPKIPSARPRVPSLSAQKPTERRPSIDTAIESLPNETPEVVETTSSLPPPKPHTSSEEQKRPSKSDRESAKTSQEAGVATKALSQSHERPQREPPAETTQDRQEQAGAPTDKTPLEVEHPLPSIETGRGTVDQTPIPTSKSKFDTLQRVSADPSLEPQSVLPAVTTTSAATLDVEGRARQDRSEPAPPPKPATKAAPKGRTPAVATQEPDGDETESARPKKRQRKASQQSGDSAPSKPRKRQASSSTGDGSEAKPRPRRARSLTPEDAESQLVDLQQLKMADLTKDLRIGKKFSRHDELRERERQARIKVKLGKDSEQADGEGSASASPLPDGRTKKSATPGGSSTPAPTSGPQFRIVDGQIVVDQSSLVMDRHARAAAAQAGEDMETIEENDFTRLITSSSFMNTSKLRGPNIWTDQETELFYRGLRMFGTEFEMISKMFPGKQRRHVKLKFNREERHNPKRIDAALIGEKTIKMDIAEYKAFTGAEYESVETIEAEQRKIQEGYEAERQRIADEQEEIMRKKKEELFADEDGDEVAGKKRKGKKKGKQAVRYGLNGEPIAQDA
ncbi:hypothetical protein JDV02_000951 [Purpureocillium takamizusanense]|uniref:Myb-like domain-containing protein n=1 Tax=Purpureocillium takamizusanense TaxID=2060973 RepID=A0A9Q8Q752_9HYPO|nr:uncharacterized protein JDV02_000951 [Purpureocillium takamizusanense]UNI14310.1 hypothetical protein JDV02_000951 [Purpureocillium takamizusanense]